MWETKGFRKIGFSPSIQSTKPNRAGMGEGLFSYLLPERGKG
jgi:hypothetical protein